MAGAKCSDNEYGTSGKNRSVSQLPTFIISSEAAAGPGVQTNFVATGRSVTNKTSKGNTLSEGDGWRIIVWSTVDVAEVGFGSALRDP
jgi:hypothetical protein